MQYDQFVVTHLDPAADSGYVRQVSSAKGAQLVRWPIGFALSAVAEAVYDEDGNVRGYRIPRTAILARVPEIGDELLGVIAADESGEVAFDAQSLMFLRNWFYADQRNIFSEVLGSIDESDDDYVYHEDPYKEDDYDPADDSDDDGYIDDDSRAEIEHGIAHGMYNS